MRRRWSINGRFLTQPLTGVQRYAECIVGALDGWLAEGHPLAQDLDIELLVPDGTLRQLRLSNIKVRRVDGAGGQAWEQTSLSLAALGGLISLCNTGPVWAKRHIVCIHDVNTRLCPQSYSWQFRSLYRVLMPALGRTAARITTVSEFSARQLVRFGVARADGIVVAPDGHEHALLWEARHSAETAAAASPRTVVLLASRAPHKNIDLILGLQSRLVAHGIRIAVVGSSNTRVFAGRGGAPQTGAGGVTELGRLDDNALAALLGDSLCLAFPSLTEGLGLPPLEAMAIGVPVIAADCSSLPEICGDAALYASPHDADAWLQQIVKLANDAELRAGLAAAGRRQAARFSWRASAERYLEIMAELDHRLPAPAYRRQAIGSESRERTGGAVAAVQTELRR